MKLKKMMLIVGVVVLAAAGYYYYAVHVPVDAGETSPVSVVVRRGETAEDIGRTLKEHNLIRSTTAFGLYTKKEGKSTMLLSGRFVLHRSMNIPEILNILTDTTKAETVITIQEGLRASDIDAKLAEAELLKTGEFITAVQNFNGWQYYSFIDQERAKKLHIPLEGYLYPDTYFTDGAEFKPDDLIYRALDNFEKKWNNLEQKNNSEILKRYSLHEIITMASIVENEVFGKEDRSIVAGILWKRLENQWTLGADITLLYQKKDRTLTRKDIEEDTPYNTRLHKGLPPGPISNPSIESINAVLFPKETPYWFYLTTLDTGEVIYAKTNDEQNAHRAKYLQ